MEINEVLKVGDLSQKKSKNIFTQPKAVIFDTDTLFTHIPAHKEATRAVEEKAKNFW